MESGLKHLAQLTLSFATCSRGDNLRNLKLSEIGLTEQTNEFHQFIPVIRTVWRKSKKNQYGKMEQNVVLR